MIIAATGHRPNKLGGYSKDVETRLLDLALRYLVRNQPNEVISGLALGWDTAIAQAALRCRLPLVAAIPFSGFEARWPQDAQDRYRGILRFAKLVHVVTPGGYAPWKLQKRNAWMVDHCDRLVALWDGSSGGTFNCLKYANVEGKPHDNLWDEWRKLNEST